MGAAKLVDEVTRFNREDQKRTKHNSQFFKWKVLIGPHDWEDHSAGKEGVARYRIENLPKTASSGLYELAIYKPSSRDHNGKLDSDKVWVVYLGEADNVRSRLQQYGRTGAHLGRNDSGDSKVCGCFEDIFARGYLIVYRWAPMENKADARRTEAQLLRTFDYAWNKGSNGERRHDDILQKLDKHASNLMKLANFSKKHLPFLEKQVGIKIKASKLVSDDNEFSKYKNGENRKFLLQVFNFSRSRPRLVSNHSGSDENETFSCGVVLDDGSICKRPPVEGRKRCAEHKGKKTRGSSTRSSTKSQPHKEDYPEIERCSPICGVAMDDGSLCRRQPVSGRKRCDVHKGRRIYSSDSKITRYQTMPYAVFDSYSDEKASVFDENHTGVKITTLVSGLDETSPSHVFDSKSSLDSNGCSTPICGVLTCNGTPCKRTVNGNGRCWQHLKYSGSRSSSNDFTPQNSNNDSPSHVFDSKSSLDSNGCSTPICGVLTCNGTPCKRTVNGNGRCWQHLKYSGSRSSSNDFTPQNSYNYSPSHVFDSKSSLDSNGCSTPICGVLTCNGTPCKRTVNGNGRCWQHLKYSGSRSSSNDFTPQNSYNYSPSHVFDSKSSLDSNGCSTPICGVLTCNGTPCKRTVNGNGRCWQHLKYSGSRSSSNDFTPQNSYNYSPSHVFDSKSSLDSNGCSTPICGVLTCNGTPCKRTVNGNGRCWQHLKYSGSRSSSNDFTPQNSYNYSSGTSICGAPTRNGSSCRRTVKGNGRCWQH